MDKNKIIEYFNEKAKENRKSEAENAAIDQIMNISAVKKGCSVLDVGCGDGRLFEYFEKLEAGILIGVDISPEMLMLARKRFPLVTTICGDAAELSLQSRFDCIVINDTINYFAYPEQLIHNMSHLLKPGGRLTIAQDLCKNQQERIKKEFSLGVSTDIPKADLIAQTAGKYINVDTLISDRKKFIISGTLEFEHDAQKGHHHNPDAKKKQLNRIARASGHLTHVKSMLENDEDVSDILIQLSAVIAALNGLGKDIINEHIVHCLSHAIENGDEKAIDDLKKAIDRFI